MNLGMRPFECSEREEKHDIRSCKYTMHLKESSCVSSQRDVFGTGA